MADRKFFRFQPDENALALIDLKFSTKEFKPTVSGLILNESYSGCALVVASDQVLKLGGKVKVKIGNLHVMKGEIVWAKVLEENIQKIGIKLLE